VVSFLSSLPSSAWSFVGAGAVLCFSGARRFAAVASVLARCRAAGFSAWVVRCPGASSLPAGSSPGAGLLVWVAAPGASSLPFSAWLAARSFLRLAFVVPSSSSVAVRFVGAGRVVAAARARARRGGSSFSSGSLPGFGAALSVSSAWGVPSLFPPVLPPRSALFVFLCCLPGAVWVSRLACRLGRLPRAVFSPVRLWVLRAFWRVVALCWSLRFRFGWRVALSWWRPAPAPSALSAFLRSLPWCVGVSRCGLSASPSSFAWLFPLGLRGWLWLPRAVFSALRCGLSVRPCFAGFFSGLFCVVVRPAGGGR
jgi:hypothetical protein